MLTAASAANAQTPAAAAADRGYVEAVAQSAFGNVTSQSFGAEIGVTVRPELQVFGSFGNVRDVVDGRDRRLGDDDRRRAHAAAARAPSAIR